MRVGAWNLKNEKKMELWRRDISMRVLLWLCSLKRLQNCYGDSYEDIKNYYSELWNSRQQKLSLMKNLKEWNKD